MDELTSDQVQELRQLYLRFYGNLRRSFKLMQTAIRLGTDDDPVELSPEGEDIIRAMIVFLHASLEDFLRELARLLYRRLPKDFLDKLPIRIGAEKIEKIKLGTLAQHSEKRVADLVKESIDDWLANKSFGNEVTVCAILDNLKIDYEEQKQYLPGLDQLMRRRHRIVHNADLASPTDIEPQSITLAESQAILNWFHDVDYFVSELALANLPPALAQPILEELETRKSDREKLKKKQADAADDDVDNDDE